MRVLMLIHNMADYGGNYLRAFPIATSLVEMGFEVTLMASRRRPSLRASDERHQGVRILQSADILPERLRHGGLSPMDWVGRMSRASQLPFDLIHGFSHRPAVTLAGFRERRRRNVPYISDWADLWGSDGILEERNLIARWTMGRLDHHAEQQAHLSADAVTAISTDLVRRARDLGVPPDRIRLVPVGANTDAIVPLPKAAMRAEFGLPPKAPILVDAGFSPYDARLMAETFVHLARRVPDILLLETGTAPPLFHRLLRSAGCADRIRDMGIVPYSRLGRILACGDIMMIPFSRRGVNLGRFPNRFGDYLAAGRPIATNDTPDVGTVVRAERVGITADDDPLAFSAAIQDLLASPESMEDMGRRARRLAETRLSWRALARDVADLYHVVSAEHDRHE
jgi:glycosyltransferase involved in cell wall biosynthesis